MGVLATAGPRLHLVEDTYAFGEVVDGTYVTQTYTITNTGDEVLRFTEEPVGRIEDPPSLCPCVEGNLPARTLAPGDSLELEVTFESTGYAGQELTLLVELHSNDPQAPVTNARLKGAVLPREPHQGSAYELHRGLRLLIDVREPEALDQGKLLGAINIPYAELPDWLNTLSKELVYYLYDDDGARAAEAAQKMQDAGFIGAMSIAGGLVGWWDDLGDLLVVRPDGETPEPPTGTPHTGRYATPPSRVLRSYNLIVDIRPEEAFTEGHILGATRMPAEDVMDWARGLPGLDRLPSNANVNIWIVDDGTGDACRLAEELYEDTYTRALCVLGGIEQWKARGYGVRSCTITSAM